MIFLFLLFYQDVSYVYSGKDLENLRQRVGIIQKKELNDAIQDKQTECFVIKVQDKVEIIRTKKNVGFPPTNFPVVILDKSDIDWKTLNKAINNDR